MILFDFLLKNPLNIEKKKAQLSLQEDKVEEDAFTQILHNFLQQKKRPLEYHQILKPLKLQNSIKLEEKGLAPLLQNRLTRSSKALPSLQQKSSFPKPLHPLSVGKSKDSILLFQPKSSNSLKFYQFQNSETSFSKQDKNSKNSLQKAIPKKEQKVLERSNKQNAFIKIFKEDEKKALHFTKVSKKQIQKITYHNSSTSFREVSEPKREAIGESLSFIEQKEQSKKDEKNVLAYSAALYNQSSIQNFANDKLILKEEEAVKSKGFENGSELINEQKDPQFKYQTKEIIVKNSSKRVLKKDNKAFLKDLTLQKQNFSQEKLTQKPIANSAVEAKELEQQSQHTLTPKILQNLTNGTVAIQKRNRVILEQKSKAQIYDKKPEFIQDKKLIRLQRVSKNEKPILQNSHTQDTNNQASFVQESMSIAAHSFDDQGTFHHSQSSHTSLQNQSSIKESGEQFTVPHPQRQTLTLKVHNTLINVNTHHNQISMHFISSAVLHFHPDIEEFIANVMQEGGYEKYRIILKDKQKKVLITSQESIKSSSRKNSSINVKA